MIEEIRPLVDKYAVWLKDKTVLRQIKDAVEITTPYLDRHNDYIQIYVQPKNGNYELSDDGYTINDLLNSGCDLSTPKRQDLLNVTLRGFGIERNGDALTVKASSDNFPIRKHNLMQAMLAVNDLFYLASPTVANLFFEDVASWLDLHDIRYTPRVKLTGKTGYDYLFDFVIPKSRVQPERVIKTINRPTADAVKAYVMSWVDTKDARAADSRSYAFLNNTDFAVSTSALGALESYEVKPVMWTERDSIRQELAA